MAAAAAVVMAGAAPPVEQQPLDKATTAELAAELRGAEPAAVAEAVVLERPDSGTTPRQVRLVEMAEMELPAASPGRALPVPVVAEVPYLTQPEPLAREEQAVAGTVGQTRSAQTAPQTQEVAAVAAAEPETMAAPAAPAW
jgi:hypothetical protein